MSDSGKVGRFPLIVLGLLLAIPLPASAQADPPTPRPVSGRPVTLEGITPSDVLARVELLRGELELIRFEMGQPKDQRPEIAVTDVSPREVIFQALTLFRKANQLNFELTGDPGPGVQVALPRDIRPYHVWFMVDGSYKRLLDLRRKLGIREQVKEELQDPGVTPTEVFRAIVQANRQFDLLLKQPPSTGDVYHQVTLATYLAARLLEQFPEATPMPAAPAFEHGKRPADVHQRLVECYARIRAITEHSEIEALQLDMPEPEAGANDPVQIRPSDVYNIAILLVSELAYLHGQLEESEPPVASYDPGLKLPAHVYQRAGLLLRQLTELEKVVAANPNWLD